LSLQFKFKLYISDRTSLHVSVQMKNQCHVTMTVEY